jgi:anti-sigma regulatory factor (Ser/Thr protein kinase)
MRHARRFHCRPESVAGARRFVRDLLSDQPRETVEAAELMTSELATNSVRHARSEFELAIHVSRDEIRVEVSDHGQGQPVPRSPTAREQSGRGLQIVQALAEDWGITTSTNGKLVWFTLRLHTHTGEHKSALTASSEKAPEQSHESEQIHETHLRSPTLGLEGIGGLDGPRRPTRKTQPRQQRRAAYPRRVLASRRA